MINTATIETLPTEAECLHMLGNVETALKWGIIKVSPGRRYLIEGQLKTLRAIVGTVDGARECVRFCNGLRGG